MSNVREELELAAFIREIDGNNKMGASQLAEKILDWQAARAQGGAESIDNRSEIYRRQAEAIISATNKCQIKSATDDSKCYSAALLDYAKQLNWWADKLDADK